MSLGYLERTSDKEALLSVSEKGKLVMNGSEKVMLRKSPFRVNEKNIILGGKGKTPDFGPNLLQPLRETRKCLAARRELEPEDVVPYVKLHRLAAYLPDNLTDLQRITGFDDAQLKSYGNAFLKVIAGYLDVNRLQTRMSSYRKSSR